MSTSLCDALRAGLAELELIGQRRASANFKMHQLHEHMQGEVLADEARRLKREIDRIEAKFGV